MKSWRAFAIAAVAAGAVFLLGARPVHATLEFQKAAKEAGFAEATNCMYCHAEKLPKKGAATFNERGQWLKDQKAARKAEKVDVTWLKEYKAAAK
jgi:hypothetical protein